MVTPRNTTALLAGLVVGLVSTAAHAAVFTNTRDVSDCAPATHGVWTATSGGLALVDVTGKTVRVWTAVDGLPATRVHAVLVDGPVLWVGTERGLARTTYAAGKLTVTGAVSSRPVHGMARHGGALYVATWGEGVHKLDAAQFRLAPLPMTGGNAKLRARVTALASHGGALWASTAGSGLFRSGDDGHLRHVTGRLARAHAWSLLSRRSDLWVGSLDGTFRIAGSQTKLVHAADARDFTVMGDTVTAAAFGQGAVALDEASAAPRNVGPSRAVFATAVASTPHGTCVGTKRGMWTRARAGARWVRADLGGPTSNDISALAIDGARVWVGMFDKGLGVFEGDRFRAIHHKNLDHYVNGVAIERGRNAGRTWVATNYGLTVLHKGTAARFTRREGMPSDMVFSVTALRRGGVLAGTARGGVVIKNGRVQAIGSKHSVLGNVWSVAEAPDGSMWLGTTLGAYHGRPGKRWTRYSVASGHLPNDWVTAIAVKGTSVWLGTYNAGVTRMDLDQPGAVATHLGGGWVNPGGLHVSGNLVYAATMDGAFVRTIGGDSWRTAVPRHLGKDTTVTATSRRGLWIATRRGLLLVARK